MREKTTKTKLVESVVEQNPNLEIREYTNFVWDKHKDLFESKEHVRTTVRTVRGVNGKSNREKYTNKYLFQENFEIKKLEPININRPDYILKHKKPLILSDIHLPYHDFEALNVALEYGVQNGCDSILLNGDILDCEDISDFAKKLDGVSMNFERDVWFEFIEYIKQLKVPIMYKVGNHENRLQRYLLKKAPELARLDELQLENFLKLKDLDIEYISNLQLIKAGKLNIMHGHEFGGFVFNPVNPARGLFNRAKTNALCGHFHQTSSHHENNLNNEGMACFTTGALCQLNPEYRPFAYTKWNIGFAFVEIFEDGFFHVHNKRIIDGRVS